MARSRRRSRRKKKRRDRRKAIYVLPNLVTTASLFAGFFAIVKSLEGDFYLAALAILTSLVFDGLDGRVARATKTVSQFGVEYDSLADLAAFGVAPAIMVYLWCLHSFGRLGMAAAFLFVACGALRLARFNVQAEETGTKHFVGLPIPAAASTLAVTVILMDFLGYPGPAHWWPVVGGVFVLSFLMVSNIPYLSLKDVGLSRLKSFNWLVAAVLSFILVAVQPQVMGFAVMLLYVTLGPLGALAMEKKRAREDKGAVEEQVTSA